MAEGGVEIPVTDDIRRLGRVDVAIVCAPTRRVGEYEEALLETGVNTVDSFDIHGQEMWNLRERLAPRAQAGRAAAIIAAGWDPGTDSIVRALMEVLAPKGITYTNFGPGMSMGHSVAVRAIPGVRDAISLTIPAGYGVHRRLVYVELDGTHSFAEVESKIKADPYFIHDDTRVTQVESIDNLKDAGHGVVMERKGTAGMSPNQLLKWEMRVDNPSLTGQVMVGAARASLVREPGVYTLLEIPIADMLPGSLEEKVKRLV
jgi:diaminopimelate dehydrogenase